MYKISRKNKLSNSLSSYNVNTSDLEKYTWVGVCRVKVRNNPLFTFLQDPSSTSHKGYYDELVSPMRFYNPKNRLATSPFEGK